MSETISFSVQGIPVPKGSFTPTKNGGFRPAGNNVRIREWRTEVTYAARQAMGARKPFVGAIRLSADFSLPYPHSIIRKYQFGWLPHIKKPDVDKLLRSICDHLNGLTWMDDSQVCYCVVNKHYAWDESPGVYIEVTEMDDQWLKDYAATRSLIKDALWEMSRDGNRESFPT